MRKYARAHANTKIRKYLNLIDGFMSTYKFMHRADAGKETHIFVIVV